MSIHIAAEKGQIAPRVLFPGDPLRAKWIAETYLSDVILLHRDPEHVRVHRHLQG